MKCVYPILSHKFRVSAASIYKFNDFKTYKVHPSRIGKNKIELIFILNVVYIYWVHGRVNWSSETIREDAKKMNSEHLYRIKLTIICGAHRRDDVQAPAAGTTSTVHA